ncbi:cellulase family glycosylhydrolase [Streptomyces cylindrosporus]|uniref:Cellulase family glycosylhydrolase n=1 Tax=Streptomyces cylindrosporus TaxID=2927583 RepID=A0ABS9XZT7_9ACTN|nr:cellulase family glycosylhydrolase [Streptomyces cylindrosporus]MCI3270488.1 cellulase family glycosylhydrolase [Streptomyces cylindrosporus]
MYLHGRRPRIARTALVLLVAGALLAAGCTPRASSHTSLRLGIAYGDRLVWMSDRDLAASLDDAVAVGARWVRADLSWQDVQADGPDRYRWGLFDRVVTAAEARGLTVLPVLAYTPAWARAGRCADSKCGPADPEAFAAFAGAAAARYTRRGIGTWEIWNEPNIPAFWHPAPDATAYATLLRATSRALRRVDPSAKVVLGGLSAAGTEGAVSAPDFLAAVLAHGGKGLFDAVGYHPYTYSRLASARVPPGTEWDGINRAHPSLHGVLAAHAMPDTPVWITEFGAPTNGPGHVTEQRQALIAADVVRTAVDTPHVGALIWYTDRDPGTDTSTVENFFGLRRADGRAKPAFDALRRAVTALRHRARGATAGSVVADEQPLIHTYSGDRGQGRRR